MKSPLVGHSVSEFADFRISVLVRNHIDILFIYFRVEIETVSFHIYSARFFCK